MPLCFLNFVVIFVHEVFLVLFYLGCDTIHLEISSLPLLDYPNYFFQGGAEVWVWGQHVPDKILHFLWTAVGVFDIGVDDAEFALLLEGMVAEVHDEEHAA